MPVFTIDAPNGDTYEIEAPAGATKDQAFEFFKREHSAGRVQPKPKKQISLLENPITGVGETALTMLTGALSQPLSGLAGLATGSADTVRNVQEALTYHPHGDTGKRYTENVGKVFNYPIEKAGELAYNTTGSEAARSIAEAGTEIGLNFLPLGAAAKGGKKLLSRKPIEVPPVRDISAVEKAITEVSPEVKPTETIYTDSVGNARTSLPDLGELTSRKAQERARTEALNKRVEEVRPTQEAFNRMSDEELQAYRESQIPEGPVDRQMDLSFDASPEEMAFHRSQQEPQMDMFAEDIQRNPVESTPDRSVPPNPQMDLLPDQAMLERRWNNVPPETPIDRQRQIEEAYAQRDQQRALEEQQRALEERLMPLEERLREEAYQPSTREQLRAERGRPYRNSQRGALDLQSISDGFQKIFNLNKKSPEVQIATKELSQRRKQAQVQNILNSTSGYVENIRTPAEVIAASENAKDIPASALLGAKTVTPGSNALAIKHPNPLIKFLRYGKNEINHFVTSASERYITSKDGIGVIIKKLSPKELTEAVQLLQLGDRKQMKITEEIMRKNGYSANQIEFVNKFYEMDKFKLDLWNRKLDEAGMPLVESREGHMPGIFKGDFKQLVLDKNNKPIGFIGVDFKWQLEAARKKMLERFPDAKFTEVSRSKLGGSGVQKAQFGEMQEVLKMLAEHDPSFADVQKMIDLAIKENSNAAYGAAYHSMKKKGIVGNEGNKPWENPEQNAKDFVKAYLQHWEEGVTSHVMLPFERDMRALMQNPELKNSERAKEYVNEYIKNMTGRSVGDVGQALNTLLDAPFKLTGLGKSTPKEIVNQLNKRAGQWTMGFGNILYTLTQYIQVAQSALPEMQSMARQLKIPLGEVTPAFTKAVSQLASHYLGKESPADATVFKEARDRGLLTFSEFSDINKITQNKHSAAFDKAVNFSRNELGERPTRPVVFFAAVDVLKRQGLEGKVLYDTAYNMTQAAMIDYHAWERPMMYSSAGVTGNLAGTLATYKHGYLNQLNRFASEARKGNVMPLISAATMLFAFAGLRGIPGYDDLNSVVEYMTEKFGGKRQNISEITMSNLPEWSKSGALSASTNVNMQGRLSTANVLPDSPIEAISPWASFYGKIGSAAGDVISNRDELSLRNLGATLLPSGPLKGIGERALNTDDQGYLLDKHGLKGNERSEWDKDVRLFTGGTSLSQSLTSTNQYMSTKRLKGYKETQKGIIQDLERKYVQGTLTDEDTKEAAKKFIDAKGDPEQLVESMIKYATTVKLNKQQRLQGIPNGSLSSLYKYQEYSDDVVR